MAKSKRGPALIEVIRKGDSATSSGSMSLPSWWRTGRRSAKAAAAPDAPQPVPEQEAPADEVPLRAELREPADEPPLVQVLGQRVVVSLSSVGAGLAVFLFIVLLGGAYLVGRDQGATIGRKEGFEQGREFFQARAADEIQAARDAAPAAGIFDDLESSPVALAGGDREAGTATPLPDDGASSGGDSSGPAAQWVKGHTYIVVQEFRTEDLDDAHAAQMFLQNQGIETVILESTTSTAYKYRLVTRKGFNRDDPAQKRLCDEYHQRIRDCGKLFVKAGGRYELQGYQKKLTGHGW